MATVFLNGQFLGTADAKVSAFDAALQHGVGLFETLLAVPSEAGQPLPYRVVHAGAHVDRLIASARALGLSESLRADGLEDALQHTAIKSAQDFSAIQGWNGRIRLRLTITGGDMNLLAQARTAREGKPAQHTQPTVMVHATPATVYPQEMLERGVGVVLADLRVNPLDPFAGHKTVNYWARLRELQRAAQQRAGEALVFQVTNYLAGGCVSNVILVKDGVLFTPIARGEEAEVADDARSGADLGAGSSVGAAGFHGSHEGAVSPSPVLPGVTRRWALEWCENQGMEVRRRMLAIDDVLGADEVLLTNSSWGVLPVIAVEAKDIGGGEVGEVGRQMVEAWAGVVAGED